MRHQIAYDDLDGLLQRWGDWQERNAESVCLPHQASFTMIYADQPAGHRILCQEMPKAIWHLNYTVQKLDIKPQRALYAWYAVSVREPGGHWTVQEKAQKLGWSVNGFRIRVHRARKALHKLMYPPDSLHNEITTGSVSECVIPSLE